jgi:hypothetical protein
VRLASCVLSIAFVKSDLDQTGPWEGEREFESTICLVVALKAKNEAMIWEEGQNEARIRDDWKAPIPTGWDFRDRHDCGRRSRFDLRRHRS